MSEGATLRHVLMLAKKDITIELRRAHEFMSILAFAVTSILVSSFAWKGAFSLSPEVISATLWIVVYFSSILALTTSFAREVDRGTIDGLRSLPCPAYSILLGKVIYGGAILLVVLISTVLSSVVFLNIDASVLPALLIVFAVGVVDLAMIGSVVSALVMYSEGKTLLLSFLFFPVSVPVLIPGTQAAGKVLSGVGLVGVVPELRLLLAFLLAIIAVSILLFRHVFLE
jgi:heme exporter protein B